MAPADATSGLLRHGASMRESLRSGTGGLAGGEFPRCGKSCFMKGRRKAYSRLPGPTEQILPSPGRILPRRQPSGVAGNERVLLREGPAFALRFRDAGSAMSGIEFDAQDLQ